MTRSYTVQVSALAFSAALLLASTQLQRPEGWTMAGLYGYWCLRIAIEAALFVAFAELLGRLPRFRRRLWTTAVLAAFVSLFPFALSITALDLILGLPELNGSIRTIGIPEEAALPGLGQARINSFLLELIYLSDNHLALCLLLSVPRLFPSPQTKQPAVFDAVDERWQQDRPVDGVSEAIDSAPTDLEAHRTSQKTDIGYQRHLERPLEGDLVRVEAQEHYVRLISQTDSCMVLYRFNDIVSELSDSLGMQVHRSHWVAFGAIEKSLRESGRIWLLLSDESKIPVSRKHVEDVQRYLSKMRRNEKKAVS